MNEQEVLWRLGQRIKKLREEKNIVQETIAFNLDTDKANISRLESGRVNPRFITLYNMAKELGISVNELVNIDFEE